MSIFSAHYIRQRHQRIYFRWKSISNDELIRPQPKYSLANTRIAELTPSHVRLIPVQQAGDGAGDDNTDPQRQNPGQPRKFSKYDPTKHSHGVGYFYGSTEGGDVGSGSAYQDGVATTLDPSVCKHNELS